MPVQNISVPATTRMTKMMFNYSSFLLFILDLLACFPAELIWKYGSCRELVGLLGWVISHYFYRTTDTEEKRIENHASSGIRIHDPSSSTGEDRAVTVFRSVYF
jgi:hypothetical protein